MSLADFAITPAHVLRLKTCIDKAIPGALGHSEAAAYAWLAHGLCNDGGHIQTPNTFHPLFHAAREATKDLAGGGVQARQQLRNGSREGCFDQATAWDRISGGGTFIIHVNGSTRALPDGHVISPEDVCMEVYLPPWMLKQIPGVNEAAQHICQHFAENIGVPVLQRWREAALNGGYSLAVDPNGAQRPKYKSRPFRAPQTPNSAFYLVYGVHDTGDRRENHTPGGRTGKESNIEHLLKKLHLEEREHAAAQESNMEYRGEVESLAIDCDELRRENARLSAKSRTLSERNAALLATIAQLTANNIDLKAQLGSSGHEATRTARAAPNPPAQSSSGRQPTSGTASRPGAVIPSTPRSAAQSRLSSALSTSSTVSSVSTSSSAPVPAFPVNTYLQASAYLALGTEIARVVYLRNLGGRMMHDVLFNMVDEHAAQAWDLVLMNEHGLSAADAAELATAMVADLYPSIR